MTLLVVIALVSGALYLVSCAVHPYRRCPRCSGTGRHWSPLFLGASRLCTRCGGRNRIRRAGSHLINAGQNDLRRPWLQGPDP